MSNKQYNVTISSGLDQDLDSISKKLNISKGETLRRALVLFKHAVDAESIKLVIDGQTEDVLIK